MSQPEHDIDIFAETKKIWKILEQVNDPEVPVLSVIDLGIIRDIKLNNDETEVLITPTYSGCPAMDVISMSIKMTLLSHGYKNIKIKSVVLCGTFFFLMFLCILQCRKINNSLCSIAVFVRFIAECFLCMLMKEAFQNILSYQNDKPGND